MRRLLSKGTIIFFTFLLISIGFIAISPSMAYAEGEVPIRVIVTDCLVTDGGLRPGKTSTVVIKIKNTSPTTLVQNVLITAKWEDDNAPVAFDTTNQYFIGSIKPNTEYEAEFWVTTKSVALLADTIQCNLTIEYAVQDVGERTNAVQVQIPVYHEAKSELPVIEWNPGGTSSNTVMLLLYIAGFCIFGLGALVWLVFKLFKPVWIISRKYKPAASAVAEIHEKPPSDLPEDDGP